MYIFTHLFSLILYLFNWCSFQDGRTPLIHAAKIISNHGFIVKLLIDAGADVVIGHGPHVPRALELYKSRLIAYSLGNFCTYAKFNLKGISGYAPLLTFKVNQKGEFSEGKIYSFLQQGEGGPMKDETNAAAQLIRQLSIEDFPESTLLIDEEGKISVHR